MTKVIASANGLEATRQAYALIQQGMDTLDAVVAGVTLVEDDPDELTVGYGGLPNEAGVVELDAAVMHGPSSRAGAVAALQRVRHPAAVARLVMRHTDHVLLAGDGALQFARAHGFVEENLLTEKARRIWLHWKLTLSDKDDWLPPTGPVDPDVAQFFKLTPDGQPLVERLQRPAGTVHCAAINAAAEISCVTSTSGLPFKIPGRVGDSPIIGAGLFVDNDVGSCGSTGRGEATLKNVSSFAAVELMRGGMSPREAGLEVMRRVVRHTTEPQLLNAAGEPNFNLTLYLLAKGGDYAGISLREPRQFAITDAHGTRLEDCTVLL